MSPIISVMLPMPGIRPITFCSGPSLPICESCLRKSSSVNSPFCEPLFLPPHFVLVEFLLRFFDEREQVALAEDAAGHAVGVEFFERVEVLARADELDRHAGDLLDGEGRAAAGVAVELRHDDAVELELLVEDLRAVDGVLARHAVDDQIHLLRRDLAIDPLELAPSARRRCAAGRPCRGSRRRRCASWLRARRRWQTATGSLFVRSE